MNTISQISRRMGILPPDPEGENAGRAATIIKTLDAFGKESGHNPDNAVKDLLANLMHWCDRSETPPINFEDELEKARVHYNAETGGDGG